MKDEVLTLSHATERDVDILLVEEFKCSPTFASWFVKLAADKVGAQISFSQVRVAHSRRRMMTRREIDIELVLTRAPDNRPVGVIYIENKLDTVEQFEQAESYRAEADHVVAQGFFPVALTVLVSPTSYLAGHRTFASKFDAVITYEMVADALESRVRTETGEIAARLQHRTELMRQAIGKSRRSYDPVVSAPISGFWKNYVDLCAEAFPSLQPGQSLLNAEAGGESKTAIFANRPGWTFLPKTRLVHQLRASDANFCFYSWGGSPARIEQMAKDLKGTPYEVRVSKSKSEAPSVMISVSTPTVDNLGDFDAQRSAVFEGMAKTAELYAWVLSQGKMIEQWSLLQ